MKKYLSVTKATILEQLQYLGNLFGGFFVYGIIIFMFLQLWQHLYGSGDQLIAGYSINQMMWYVIATELLWFSARTKAIRKGLSDDIKSGKIAYMLNKPYNYILYTFAKSMGELIPNFIAFSFFGFILGTLLIGPLETFSLISIPFIIIILVFAILISSLIHILIGLIAFWIEENRPFFWLYSKLILILGITFPIEIFPSWLASIIKFSPIYVTVYGPAKMLVDYSYGSFIEILLMQLYYLIIMTVIVTIVYKRGVKKVNVNGG